MDEPTNNLDTHGIEHLTDLIIATDKTVVVISHDEEFLNSFSDSVLYLDQHAKKVEQYDGKYVRSDIHTFMWMCTCVTMTRDNHEIFDCTVFVFMIFYCFRFDSRHYIIYYDIS